MKPYFKCNDFRSGCGAINKYGECLCLDEPFLDKDCPFFKIKVQFIGEQIDLQASGHKVCQPGEYRREYE